VGIVCPGDIGWYAGNSNATGSCLSSMPLKNGWSGQASGEQDRTTIYEPGG